MSWVATFGHFPQRSVPVLTYGFHGTAGEDYVAEDATAERSASQGVRFALAKFRPPTLPATLVTRSMLHERLTAGAGQRLTVVVGPAGAAERAAVELGGDTASLLRFPEEFAGFRTFCGLGRNLRVFSVTPGKGSDPSQTLGQTRWVLGQGTEGPVVWYRAQV